VRLRVVALALTALALAPAASARPRLGVFGPIDRFASLTGQQSTVGHVILAWNQLPNNALMSKLGEVPLLGFSMGQGAITPKQVAYGAGDSFLIELNQVAQQWTGQIYFRPYGEMNGHWNSYCAYDSSGRQRGPSHTTAMFRKAFARTYLILHGGPKAVLDAKLRKLGLPPVAQDLPLNPMPRVRVIWNPQGYGSPDLPGNRAQAYYPGDAYVDVVGNDLYDIGFKAEWAANDRLYKAHPNKPYAFVEWGLWGIDDPEFVRHMATFVRTHRRVELLSYFNAKRGSIFDLASKPKSLAAYRSLIPKLG
jgi:hypothetical protein